MEHQDETPPTDERPRREQRVQDFKQFHTTGDKAQTDKNTQPPRPGKVAAAILRIETPEKQSAEKATSGPIPHKAKRTLSGDTSSKDSTPPRTTPEASIPEVSDHAMATIEDLKQQLQQQKEINEQIKRDLEEARLRQELEAERMKQIEWERAKEKILLQQEQAKKQHEETLKEIENTETKVEEQSALEQLKKQLEQLKGTGSIPPHPEGPTPKEAQVADQLKDLAAKQQDIINAARQAVKGHEQVPAIQDLLQKIGNLEEKPEDKPDDQTKLMESLIKMIQGKPAEPKVDEQKEILKQFLTESNKTTTTGGATTLKPELLKKLTGESDKFHMWEWLSSFNRHGSEEAKCDICAEDCKHHKKSGMLDKATTNIQHKETWPQKNLLEDWADEDMEFKQMQFEHMVAGETRTIETCTNPAEILGRLKLLRRMAYAKLRGYEWSNIRKMYAAILRSIEARDTTWETNFDRYEAILYRRPPAPRDRDRPSNPREGNKKWFCRDWNKGICTKTAPHKAWFGTGTNATQRSVLHMCATCYMRDKTQKDHPENHDSCPHKEA